MTGNIDDVEARRVLAQREWLDIMNKAKRDGQVGRELNWNIYTSEEHAAKHARLRKSRHEQRTGVWADPDTTAKNETFCCEGSAP